jgi:hypothetical protein
VAQVAELNKAQPEREKESCAQQRDDEEGNGLTSNRDAGVPDELFQKVDDVFDWLHA